MTKSRAKGTRAETLVVEYLKSHGWPHAERHAQHGTRDIGDVNIGPGVVIEVKATAGLELAEWIKELHCEMDNAHGGDGVVVIKRRGKGDPGEWYALMTFAQWCEMAKEAGL